MRFSSTGTIIAVAVATGCVDNNPDRSMFAVAFTMPGRTRTANTLVSRSGSRTKSLSLPFLHHDSKRMRVSGSIVGRFVSSLGSSSGGSTSTVEDAADSVESSSFWSTDRVRSQFVSYFNTHPSLGHSIQPSSPCAPLNDPTLLFTNAGMNQFKPIFLGQADPSSPLYDLTRATNSQKCIRAGGKHNDLDDVGRDTYHHTFFEMLGSWSFGDYFKAEAVDMAWELLTKVYGLEEDRLYATYFEGDALVEPDFEARDLWLRYLPPHRVIGCDGSDNFWEMGDTGPCGPCSELHYDRIGNRDASSLVNQDDPNVLEIWNLVFIQFNKDDRGNLSTLPKQHVDTGMGLERLVSILQHKYSNYDTDAFQPIFDEITKYSQVGPYTGKLGAEDVGAKDTAYRAVADHIRTLCFAIADGAVPNNEGRGYVLRRILRRGARYGRQVLGVESRGLLSALIPTVLEHYGGTYPELREQRETITAIITEEEQSFDSMLDRGIKFFNDLTDEKNEDKVDTITGEKAFFLYDTMGFPIDLTELMAEEKGLTIDIQGFGEQMEAAKTRSREARYKSKNSEGEVAVERLELIAEQTAWLANKDIPVTNDDLKYEWDVFPEATVQAIYTSKHGFVEDDVTVSVGDTVGIILDRSSFYGEAGGQETDTGVLELLSSDDDAPTLHLEVKNVQAYAGYLLHTCTVSSDVTVRADDTRVASKVDYTRRENIAPNHTMTHVLNAALRKVLGDGVEQRGSLCNDEKLRFDFSHKKAMKAKQVRTTEELVQQCIAEELPIIDRIMPLEEAKKLDGVRAVFGEVYPDPVRVVSVGDDHSVEFCGGTHLRNTKDAEAFVLIEETAVAKGIRRISGLTKGLAKTAIEEGIKFESLVAEAESVSSDDTAELRKSIDAATISAPLKLDLRERIETLQKRLFQAKKAELAQKVDVVLNTVKESVGVAVADGRRTLVLNLPDIGADSKASQKVMNVVKELAPNMAFMGLSEEEEGSGGKLMCFALVPKDMLDDIKADEWVRETLIVTGGRGGGKPENAQGQAKACDDVEAVLRQGMEFAESKIGE